MFKIFIFFYILFSAQERQTQPILKMSSQAFAHLHYISFEKIASYVLYKHSQWQPQISLKAPEHAQKEQLS